MVTGVITYRRPDGSLGESRPIGANPQMSKDVLDGLARMFTEILHDSEERKEARA